MKNFSKQILTLIIKLWYFESMVLQGKYIFTNTFSQNDLYRNVCSSCIANSSQLETIEVSDREKRLKKLWYIHTLEHDSTIKRNKLHATKWMNCRNIVLSERKQYVVQAELFHLCEFLELESLITGERNQNSDCLRGGGGWGLTETHNIFLGEGNVLYLDSCTAF